MHGAMVMAVFATVERKLHPFNLIRKNDARKGCNWAHPAASRGRIRNRGGLLEA